MKGHFKQFEKNLSPILPRRDPWVQGSGRFTQFTQKVEVRVKGNQPLWFNEEIISLCKDRDYYKGKAQKTGSASDWEVCRHVNN